MQELGIRRKGSVSRLVKQTNAMLAKRNIPYAIKSTGGSRSKYIILRVDDPQPTETANE
jgi:hypothetical protein